MTGSDIVTSALRAARIIDPIEAPHGEQQADALELATDLLDTWRTQKLTIGGITRNVFSLTINTQSHTIGSGGTFNQNYPASIERWSVIPDDDAADVLEISKGRPLNSEEWQRIAVKSTTGSYPTVMYYDRSYSAGLGNCLFYPIPNNADVDVVLYGRVPVITSLALATSYDFRPGTRQALKLELAIALCDFYGREMPSGLEKRAARAMGSFKRSNMIPREAAMRSEFAIGARRRTFNVYTGGS